VRNGIRHGPPPEFQRRPFSGVEARGGLRQDGDGRAEQNGEERSAESVAILPSVYLPRGTTMGIFSPCASGIAAWFALAFTFQTATTSHFPCRFSETIVMRPKRGSRAEPSGFLSP
jgi:hypothetical protein